MTDVNYFLTKGIANTENRRAWQPELLEIYHKTLTSGPNVSAADYSFEQMKSDFAFFAISPLVAFMNHLKLVRPRTSRASFLPDLSIAPPLSAFTRGAASTVCCCHQVKDDVKAKKGYWAADLKDEYLIAYRDCFLAGFKVKTPFDPPPSSHAASLVVLKVPLCTLPPWPLPPLRYRVPLAGCGCAVRGCQLRRRHGGAAPQHGPLLPDYPLLLLLDCLSSSVAPPVHVHVP